MKTFRFVDFDVYEDAKKFRQLVRKLLEKFPPSQKYLLRDQIERSCLSIVLNIAEGSAKKSDKDLARFLEMSLASVNETVAAFDLALDDAFITEEDFQEMQGIAESIAKQLGGFLKSIRYK